MKAETQRAGIIGRTWSALTHNWGLKLLALVLAIIIYHSLKPKEGYKQNLNDRHLFQSK